jgi:hypothetical protein
VNADRDLFGAPMLEGTMPSLRSRAHPKKTGHAAPIGSGPSGESCKTCHHYVRVNYGGIWRKCDLMRKFWTHGPGSDIRAKDPACRHWQARAQEPSKAGKV